MSVPDYIRKDPRPVIAMVEDNDRDSPNRFAVRERVNTKYIPGGKLQTHNGRVIRHLRYDERWILELVFRQCRTPCASTRQMY